MTEQQKGPLVGVLSDVHTEDERLSRALFFMREQGVEAFLCAGDIVDGHGDAEQCISLLRGVGALTVSGNHDRWCLEGYNSFLFDATPKDTLSEDSLDFLSSLPETRELQLGPLQVLLCHGVGDDDMCSLRPYDTGYALQSNTKLQEVLGLGRYGMMIHGHTHQRGVRRIGGMLTLNPGALSDRRNDQPGFAILDCGAWRVTFYDILEDAVEAAEEIDLRGLPDE